MKKSVKLLALLLTAIFVVTLLAGCGGEKTNKDQGTATDTSVSTTDAATSGTEPAQKEVDPLAERMKISIALWEIDPEFLKTDDPIYKKVQEKLNIDIDPVVITWDDYIDKTNVWAASGQLPDVFSIDAVGTKNFFNWAKNGVVKALPDDFGAYPNVAKVMALPDVQATKYNGKFYAFPRGKYNPYAHIWATSRMAYYRKDWAQALGLQEPNTYEEFVSFVKTMVEKRPEGKKITGVVMWPEFDTFLTLPFCPVSRDVWIKDTDGRVKPGYFTQGYLEGLKAWRNMYDQGLFDKDFAIEKTEEGLDKFASGKAAVALYQLSSLDYMSQFGTKLEKTYPGKKAIDMVGVLKPLQSADGKRYVFTYPTFWSESYINANVDDKKMDRIMRLFDYMMSPEFKELATYGIERTDYTKDGDKYSITREKDDKGNFVALSSKYKFLAGFDFLSVWSISALDDNPAFPQEVNNLVKEWKQWAIDNTVVPDADFRPNFISTPLKDNFKFDFKNDATKCILSKDGVEKEYQKILGDYKAKGLEAMIDEINAALGK